MRFLLTAILVATAVGAALRFGSRAPEPAPGPAGGPVIAAASSNPRQGQAFLLPVVQPAYAPVRDTAVPLPAPDANAALVYHLETETVLFAKNEAVRAPIASLTKVLTALTVNGLLAPDDIATVSSASVRVDRERQTLYAGERIRVRDLLQLMLVESSNDAAYALAAHARTRGIDLVAEMNGRARELGMADSVFTNPAGLDDTAFSTVRDLVKLMRAAVRVPQLWEVMRQPEVQVTSVDGSIVHRAVNTNELLGTLPGIRWGKTGNTDGALGCMLLVVQIPGKDDTLVSIVLGSRARFADSRTLIEWAQRAWRWGP